MRITERQLRRIIREELANQYNWDVASRKKFMLDKPGMEQEDKDNVESYLKSMSLMESRDPFIDAYRRAISMVSPKFGEPGMSKKEAVIELVETGVEKSIAYFAVVAALQEMEAA